MLVFRTLSLRASRSLMAQSLQRSCLCRSVTWFVSSFCNHKHAQVSIKADRARSSGFDIGKNFETAAVDTWHQTYNVRTPAFDCVSCVPQTRLLVLNHSLVLGDLCLRLDPQLPQVPLGLFQLLRFALQTRCCFRQGASGVLEFLLGVLEPRVQFVQLHLLLDVLVGLRVQLALGLPEVILCSAVFLQHIDKGKNETGILSILVKALSETVKSNFLVLFTCS